MVQYKYNIREFRKKIKRECVDFDEFFFIKTKKVFLCSNEEINKIKRKRKRDTPKIVLFKCLLPQLDLFSVPFFSLQMCV